MLRPEEAFSFDLNLKDGLIAFCNHPSSFAFLQSGKKEGKAIGYFQIWQEIL